VHASDTRAACLDYVNKNWTDMRPKSLIKRMEEAGLSVDGPEAGRATKH
jgi:MbtH protein